ncbi:glucose PTS transporter subunit IIA, partial [uncultured Actinomyces sp.]
TEPAIFGVNLRLRWPFFIGMAAAGVGGAGVALLDVRSQALGAAGLVGLVSIVPTSIPRYLALEGLVFILAFVGVFAYATARSRSLTDDVDDAGTAVSKADAQLDSGTTSAVEFPRNAGADLSVTAPIHGIAISLSEVGDRTFASGVLGPGAAIDPVEGPVVSPVDGEVLVAFPTGHAYGLRSASGIELLIHVGMDTVELDGKYFTPRVAAGKRVHRGQVLVEVDWAAVTRAGYRTTTPVVVSNAASFAGIVDEHVGRIVERGDALYTVEAIEPVAARPPASA